MSDSKSESSPNTWEYARRPSNPSEPPNQPALDFVADGKYSATGQFTMRGWWRIEVIITRGGQTQSAFFDVGL